jgi:SAM-dependent methyltransferase
MNAEARTWEEAVQWLRSQPDQASLVAACFFDDPLLEAGNRYYECSEWRAIQGLLGPGNGRTVLDIGAGRGISSFAFARDGWRVIALEPDPSNLVGTGAIASLAASGNVDIGTIRGWGESIPFNNASFDFVYGRQVLHHARDLRALCQEMARVLKPGGGFLATREHVIFYPGDLARFRARHPLQALYGGECAYRRQEYQAAITGSGIEIKQVFNPWATAINLYPRSPEDIADVIHRRTRVIPRGLLRPNILALLGWLLRTAGASYSFFGTKR